MSQLFIELCEATYSGIVPKEKLDKMMTKIRVDDALKRSHPKIDLTTWALNHLCETALESDPQDLLELQGEVQMLTDAIENRIDKICQDCAEGIPVGFVECRFCGGDRFIN